MEDGSIPTRTLWVGNIKQEGDVDAIVAQLETVFGKYGALESVRVLPERFCAFINYVDVEPAVEARDALQGTVLNGQTVVINFRRTPAQTLAAGHLLTPPGSEEPIELNAESRALWIGNVSDTVTEADIAVMFRSFGAIESVRTLRAKTCAFVNFILLRNARNALETMQGVELAHHRLRINFGKQQPTPRELPFIANGSPLRALPLPADSPATPATAAPPTAATDTASDAPHDETVAAIAARRGIIETMSCVLCRQRPLTNAFAPCGHCFCEPCTATLRAVEVVFCPFCRTVAVDVLDKAAMALVTSDSWDAAYIDERQVVPPTAPDITNDIILESKPLRTTAAPFYAQQHSQQYPPQMLQPLLDPNTGIYYYPAMPPTASHAQPQFLYPQQQQQQ